MCELARLTVSNSWSAEGRLFPEGSTFSDVRSKERFVWCRYRDSVLIVCRVRKMVGDILIPACPSRACRNFWGSELVNWLTFGKSMVLTFLCLSVSASTITVIH